MLGGSAASAGHAIHMNSLEKDKSGKGWDFEVFKNKKNTWIIPVYGIFYMASFILLEKKNAKLHIIHSVMDDYIPFCEYFIIPYVLWFLYVACVLGYFAFGRVGKKEYYQLIATLGTGLTIFIITSFVYPNGHTLRPELTGDGIFIQAVRILYRADTPTNILPSMHVFCSGACWLALYEHGKAEPEGNSNELADGRKSTKQRIILLGTGLLTISIILSTVFLKQHSVIDVMTALLLNIACYQIFYRFVPMYDRKRIPVMPKRKILTIQNQFSVIRRILAFLFFGIFASVFFSQI